MIGTTIGNYLVRDKIGEGGMGVVYLAEHVRIGRKVAIKVLLPEYSQNPEVVSRFFTEARASAAIKNEHIIDIIDEGKLPDGSSYIIMEWLEGEPLVKTLEREKRLPLERTLHIARGIARALAAAHARNIVHRDLKPDNVFLVQRGDDPDFAKVLDFGIAKLLGNEGAGAPQVASKTRTGAIIGTPMYMSPEQCRGVAVDARSDIYSCGVIIYQMLVGVVPFQSEGLGELLLKHMTEAPRPLRELDPSLPEQVEIAVLRALEKDPDKRYRRIEDFVADLGAQITVARPAARPTTPIVPPPTAVRAASATDTIGAASGEAVAGAAPRRRTGAGLLIGAGLAAGGVVLALALIGGRPAAPSTPVPAARGSAGPMNVDPPKAPTPAPGDPAPPSPTPLVRFDVHASPPEAMVVIDGVVRENPTSIEVAPGQVHEVEVTARGFAAFKKKVAVDKAEVLGVVLDPEAAKGGRHGDRHAKLPAAPRPDAKTDSRPDAPAAKSDAPVAKKAEASVGKKEDKTPLYKGTKAKLDTDYPGGE